MPLKEFLKPIRSVNMNNIIYAKYE